MQNQNPAESGPDLEYETAFQSQIKLKIAEVAAIADQLPGVVIIHNNETLSVEYMSERGLKLLGTTLEELKALGPAYHDRFFNPEEAKIYVPKIFSLLERNDPSEWINFFQQVRHRGTRGWTWYATGTKILLHNGQLKPILSISVALPLDVAHHNTTIVERLQKENDFLRENYNRFSKLTRRECDVLKLTCLGKSSQEISESLFISPTTVDTHRRNIKKKLQAENTFELSQYAMAFELI